MQPKKSGPPFDMTELTYAILAIVALILVLLSTACVSVDSSIEPTWRPQVFLSVDDGGPCRFVWAPSPNDEPVVIPCDPDVLRSYYLAPKSDLVTLKSKLQQCDSWR